MIKPIEIHNEKCPYCGCDTKIWKEIFNEIHRCCPKLELTAEVFVSTSPPASDLIDI